MTIRSRDALPSVPPVSLVNGSDTSAQARENRRRVVAYLDRLRKNDLPLPADPQQPNRLSMVEAARESGVNIGSLRSGAPSRELIDGYHRRAGLAVIVKRSASCLTAEEFLERLPLLAHTAARAEGASIEVMTSRLEDVASLIARRSRRQAEKPVGYVITCLCEEANANILELPDGLTRLLPHLVAWCDSLNETPDALNDLEFIDVLNHAFVRIGVNKKTLAGRVGVKLATLSRWLNGQSVPCVRSFNAVRKIERLAGLPEGTLLDARRPKMDGYLKKLDWSYIPLSFRKKGERRTIASVRARLKPEDFELSDAALREHIHALFEDVVHEHKAGRDRHAFRTLNRIDRSRFSHKLKLDIEEWSQHLLSLGRSPATVRTYTNGAEGLLAYGLSDEASPELRLDAASARLSHVASPQLWEAHFAHKEANSRRATDNPHFLIHRCSIERMKEIQAMFDPVNGYVRHHQDLIAAIRQLGPVHHCFISDWDSDLTVLDRVGENLRKVRSRWMRRSRAPTRGRDEISDLLELPNPIIAVREMVLFQRKVASECDWENVRRTTKIHFSTAMRLLMVVQLLGQTALRIGMLSRLTVGCRPMDHLMLRPDRPPLLRIPAALFKNGGSGVFRDGPYEREIEDCFGILNDLELYMSRARPVLLGDTESNLLFPARGGKPLITNNLRGYIECLSRLSIGADAPPERRLIRHTHLRPHHFRDILATQVLHDSGRDYALAADAIHVTEKTCRDYYAFDTPGMRRERLQSVVHGFGNTSD